MGTVIPRMHINICRILAHIRSDGIHAMATCLHMYPVVPHQPDSLKGQHPADAFHPERPLLHWEEGDLGHRLAHQSLTPPASPWAG